jgi:LysR family transcriptional regulator, regulator for bpeEF and oprC
MDKLRSIQYFMKVAEVRSLAAAAHFLEVSPSSVSKVIADLESSIGFALFHRSTRRLSLTGSGEAYLENCRHIVQQLDDAETQGRQQGGVITGTVKVGMHPAFRNPFFAEIADVLTKHPHLRVETKVSNSPTILFEEGFDMLIRAGDLPDSSLVARPIGKLDMVVAASPKYLKQYGEPKSPADLERHRWVLPTRIDNYLGSSSHFDFFKDGECCSVTVSSFITTRDSIGLPESVVGGAGIACLYSVSLMRPISEGLAKPLICDWMTPGRPVFAVFPNARAMTPKTKVLVEFFAALIARAGRPIAKPTTA